MKNVYLRNSIMQCEIRASDSLWNLYLSLVIYVFSYVHASTLGNVTHRVSVAVNFLLFFRDDLVLKNSRGDVHPRRHIPVVIRFYESPERTAGCKATTSLKVAISICQPLLLAPISWFPRSVLSLSLLLCSGQHLELDTSDAKTFAKTFTAR